MDRPLLEIIACIYPLAISESERWIPYGDALRYLCCYVDYIRLKYTTINDDALLMIYSLTQVMNNTLDTQENLNHCCYIEIVHRLAVLRKYIIVPAMRKQCKEGTASEWKCINTEQQLDTLIQRCGD